MEAFLESCRGRSIDVLMEREHGGRTPQFAEILLDQPAEPGSIVTAAVTGYQRDRLIGAMLS
jgi:hypothetical protein